MKRFRVLTAALCAAVLLCGFSVPAYAYAGGEGEDYGDPQWKPRPRSRLLRRVRAFLRRETL